MNEDHHEIIIVRRRGGHEDEHHGGAWKIAFADFMTAMMTFFLVLWIINATDKSTKSVIARYFNPVKLENPAKGHKGVHNESNVADPSATEGDTGAASTPPEERADKARTSPPSSNEKKKYSASVEGGKATDTPEAPDAAHPKPTLPETALLADPYASLDRIAGSAPPAKAPSDAKAGDSAPASESEATESFEDPFGAVGKFSKAAKDTETVAERRPPAPSSPPSQTKAKSTEQAVEAARTAPPAPPSSSPLSSAPAPTTAPKEKATSAAALKIVNELRAKIGEANHDLGPAIDVRATSEGVLISLTDKLNFSMFPVGSAEPQKQVVQAMNVIAQSLANHPGVIVVRGHTDARPYRSQTYDNWRLSEARAQMAYYMLTRANLKDKRVEHVEGYADRRLKNTANPYAPENRRIEILLRESEL
jgi:chemotaxis protein MotB